MSNSSFEFDFKPLIRKIQNNPSSVWILLGLAGVGLWLLAGTGSRPEPARYNPPAREGVSQETAAVNRSAEHRLEEEITQILQQISGAGRVRVDLSLKTAHRKVWERQIRTNKRVSQQQGEMDTEESTSDELVFAKTRDGTDTPVLKEELAPEVQGVLVVATGARDNTIKRLLTETVMTILDLPAHRVMVIAGKDEL
ncbi:MAG TPA: hypothetical protein VIM29_03230 [Bacillota bacterium]